MDLKKIINKESQMSILNLELQNFNNLFKKDGFQIYS